MIGYVGSTGLHHRPAPALRGARQRRPVQPAGLVRRGEVARSAADRPQRAVDGAGESRRATVDSPACPVPPPARGPLLAAGVLGAVVVAYAGGVVTGVAGSRDADARRRASSTRPLTGSPTHAARDGRPRRAGAGRGRGHAQGAGRPVVDVPPPGRLRGVHRHPRGPLLRRGAVGPPGLRRGAAGRQRAVRLARRGRWAAGRRRADRGRRRDGRGPRPLPRWCGRCAGTRARRWPSRVRRATGARGRHADPRDAGRRRRLGGRAQGGRRACCGSRRSPAGWARQVRAALAAADPATYRTGVVLDLRANPGGLLDEAVDVAGAFLDGGPVVSYETPRPARPHPAVVRRGRHVDGRWSSGGRRHRQCRRGGRRGAAGPQPRGRRRRAHLRQGLGAGAVAAVRRVGPRAHGRPLPHAQRPRHRRGRRRARCGGRCHGVAAAPPSGAPSRC